MLSRRNVLGVALAGVLAPACVFGFRGEATVTATYPLARVDTVRVNLGPTPLIVLGDTMAPGLELRGTWQSLGGTGDLAREQALAAAIRWSIAGNYGELWADVPIKLHGQVDFEVEELRLPPDRDLELETALGDVEVFAVEGNILADVGVGHVSIDGGAGGLAVRVGEGNLDILSAGHMDLVTGRGDATIRQAGPGGNDIVVRTDAGDIEIILTSDANLDLQLKGRELRVQTSTVSTITTSRFTRAVGAGSVKVWAEAPRGNVRVRVAGGT